MKRSREAHNELVTCSANEKTTLILNLNKRWTELPGFYESVKRVDLATWSSELALLLHMSEEGR